MRQAAELRSNQAEADPGDLGDLLQEVRILQQGAQMLTAFLVIVPFDSGFGKIDQIEKGVFMPTFICSVVSLALLSAPAVQHRIERPLRNSVRFKRVATRTILVGAAALSCALVLMTFLVASEVLGRGPAIVTTVFIGSLISTTWWIVPLLRRGARVD